MNPFDPETEAEQYARWEMGEDSGGELDIEQAEAQLAVLGARAKLARARELAAHAASLSAAQRQTWRDMLKATAGLSAGDFTTIVRDETKAIKAREKADAERQRAELAQQFAHVRHEARSTGVLLPSSDEPIAVARTLVQRLPSSGNVPHWSWWRGDFYGWNGTRWDPMVSSEVQNWLYRQTENASTEGKFGMEPWAPNMARIRNVEHALGVGVLNRPASAEPDEVIACRNGVLDRDLVARRLLSHHPSRFNLSSLPFEYDPDAKCTVWTKFLDEVLPGDLEATEFLQEWFGYVISGRTDLQKMASLIGPPRSGKGTIARVLHALLGPESVASPTLGALAGQFGRQSLIGKRLAILSDVRWTSRHAGDATEPLLAITGEDNQGVPRKNREDWEGKLGVRFMAMSNDIPTFKDASTALANRMIHIEFTRSFLGHEDPSLTSRLLGELPGVLNWALDGLDRLTRRGSFLAPASGDAVAEEVRRASSPYSAYVEDRCLLEPEHVVQLDALFADYCSWCDSEHRDFKGTKESFSRGLQSAFRGQVATERRMVNGIRDRYVVGLRRLPGLIGRGGAVDEAPF